jgi:nucleoside-diphosphate-sugar epimerase
VAVVHRLHRGDILPPIQLVSGVSTSLESLANLAIGLTRSNSRIVDGPPRDFDVSSFCGDPGRAACILDWTARVPLDEGLALFLNGLASRQSLHQNNLPVTEQTAIVGQLRPCANNCCATAHRDRQ